MTQLINPSLICYTAPELVAQMNYRMLAFEKGVERASERWC